MAQDKAQKFVEQIIQETEIYLQNECKKQPTTKLIDISDLLLDDEFNKQIKDMSDKIIKKFKNDTNK